MLDSPRNSQPSETATSVPTAEGKAPAGLVRTPGDATQFLDELAEAITAAQPTIEAFEGHELTRAEVEYERHLCAALRRQATLNLHLHGMRILKWIPDGNGMGYHIEARDRQGRKFEVEFHYETLDRPDFATRGDCGRAIIDEVVGALVKVREAYLSRMHAAKAEIKPVLVTTRK